MDVKPGDHGEPGLPVLFCAAGGATEPSFRFEPGDQ
jgi:hypothetical protein